MYDALKIEKKWQKFWEKLNIYKTKNKVLGRKNFYHLVMFPYPSGDLHIGHWYNFAPADVYARFKKMSGFNVLSPIGFDAFGLPAENAAIKNKIHPKIWTYKNIAKMRRQLKSMGSVYDFSREIITADPDYYKWTQWMFLKMHEADLAYKKKMLANWCPKDKAVLANEQVIDGKCWRHPDTPVIQKSIDQWMLKITDYAEDLLSGLEKLNWPEKTKLMQKNWIGKSNGALVKFKVKCGKSKINDRIEVFTTRPDTLFGATYLVLSPEHSLIEQLSTKEQKDKVRHYIANAHLKTEFERIGLGKEKTGVFTGSFAINPVNGKEIPIWISDYVLASYGSGAIMAVPAHDERDLEFAKKFNLPVVQVIGGNILKNSGKFTGLSSMEARVKITEWLKENDFGDFSVQYKLRDWIISRERYWGAPIPVVYCKKCASTGLKPGGIVPVPENKLPVKLPPLKNFKPATGGKSPLARAANFVNTRCPQCNGRATRETDTMDTFVDSSWYYLAYVMRGISDFRFPISKYKKVFAAWLPVDMYVGGAEHTVLHLLYSRFFTKVLRNLGFINFDEPFSALRHQGIILGADSQKMSKSRGNVVDPDELVKKYGADTVRMHLCFMTEYSQGGPWNPEGILGVKRFLDRIYAKFQNPNYRHRINYKVQNLNLQKLAHQTIKKVGEDIENFRFNTAISALMIFFNKMEKADINQDIAGIFLKLIAPFAPHIAEELWLRRALKNRRSIHLESWPKYDFKIIEETEYELVIQINGKLRGKITVSKNLERQKIEKLALSQEIVKRYIGNNSVRRIIFVPGRLINIIY